MLGIKLPVGCSVVGSTMEASSDILTLNRESALIPKGKEKMEEEKNGDAAICGICLTEGSLGPRGWIDSCDHYFCFICIMEWAKVESRCPMCKQRFQSIRRSEVPGLFVSERVLEIPVRNQVYHPLGNESTAISDPYAQANCQVCRGYGDEELLLLCDLCDSAFHTYCTGLGRTVPEGDWYCNDCSILREEYSRIGRDDDYRDSAFQENHSFDQISKPLVSIFEIVTDESSRIKSSVNHHFHRSSVRGDQTSQQRTSKDLMLHVEKSESSGSPSEITDSNLRARLAKQRARTLLQPCNLQSRIQVLRENWNSLRGGSVAFSSVFYGNDKTSEGSIRTSPLTKQSISSPANEKQVTDPNYSRTMVTNSMSQDVEKAWKMMQKAKKQKLTVDKSSLNSIGLISSAASVTVSKGHVSHSFRDLTSKNRIEAEKMVGCSTSGTSKLPSFKVVQNWHQFPFINHQLLGTKALNPWEHVDRIGLPTSTVVQMTHIKGFTQDGEMAARKSTCRSSSKVRGISDNNAKCEVQSLVKLNLKLLSKGQCLGNERFKVVARASTHSILAACGLEHSKSASRHFSKEICKHDTKVKLLHRSNLMPDSCRGCFFAFVKAVVKSILFEESTSNNTR